MTIFLIPGLFSLFSLTYHPFHVSVCEINHDEETKALQITHRIFLDDFEIGLNKEYNETLDLLNPKDLDKIDRLVKDYLSKRFSVKIDGKISTINYLGNELERDVIWCFMEITKVKKLQTIEIEDRVLFEAFGDQSNIVHVDYQDVTKSLRLAEKNPVDRITFE